MASKTMKKVDPSINMTFIIDGEEFGKTLQISDIQNIYEEEDGQTHVEYITPCDILIRYDAVVKESVDELYEQIEEVLRSYGVDTVDDLREYLENGDDEDDEDDEEEFVKECGGDNIEVKLRVDVTVTITLHSDETGSEVKIDYKNIESIGEKDGKTSIGYYNDCSREEIVVRESYEEVERIYEEAVNRHRYACDNYEVVSSEEFARLKKIAGEE